MSLTALLQLYAPLAGLLGVVFWLGVLSQRVKGLEIKVKDLSASNRTEREDFGRLVALETEMKSVNGTLEKIERAMSGVQRQLANLANVKSAPIVDMGRGL